MLVFYSITFLLRKGKVFQQPTGDSGEFPPSWHLGNFPPAPEFITIGQYNFTGPWVFDGKQRIEDSAIIAVLCKKNEEYDILYIGDAGSDRLNRHRDYICWLDNCDQGDLYFSILWTLYEIYEADQKKAIETELNEEVKPPCFEYENEA